MFKGTDFGREPAGGAETAKANARKQKHERILAFIARRKLKRGLHMQIEKSERWEFSDKRRYVY